MKKIEAKRVDIEHLNMIPTVEKCCIAGCAMIEMETRCPNNSLIIKPSLDNAGFENKYYVAQMGPFTGSGRETMWEAIIDLADKMDVVMYDRVFDDYDE